MSMKSFFLFLALSAAVAAQDAGWQTTVEHRTIAGNPDLFETAWQTARPGGAYDKIAVHRYAGVNPRKIAFLYLPGTNMNGELALTDERYNLWLYLAHRGFDVYALDYRTHFERRMRLHGEAVYRAEFEKAGR